MNTPSAPLIKIVVVDDDRANRITIIKQLSIDTTLKILFEAEHGQDLLDKLESSIQKPDICILDLSMPVMDGFEAASKMVKRYPKIRILVYSQYLQPYAIKNLLQIGVHGFIAKAYRREHIIKAINEIHSNGTYFAGINVEEILKQDKAQSIKNTLTRTERQIVSLICTHLSYNEIAVRTNIKYSTVLTHKKHIFKKLNVHTREELIHFAIKNELIFYN